jgi:hypothetical protein
MNRAWFSLLRKQEKRELYDPLRAYRYMLQFGKEKSSLTVCCADKEDLLEGAEEIKQVLEELYERFRTHLSDYLEYVLKEGAVWRFFDVAYGVQITVKGVDGGWEVWMGEDLGLRTENQEEAAAYLRGLIVEFDSWLEREMLQIHDAMVAMIKNKKMSENIAD